MRRILFVLSTVVAMCACASGDRPLDQFEPIESTTVLAAPAPANTTGDTIDVVAQGKYLVELLGCGACHTDGALIGNANAARALAGSRIGLAHSNPLMTKKPGVVFPSNLTSDVETGIGGMSDQELRRAIRSGVGRHGVGSLKVMPITALALLNDRDLDAIVMYLRSLEPVSHRVPDAVPEGKATAELYVHFGVYRSREN
jgi:mono/diheme cytochrome c family protein